MKINPFSELESDVSVLDPLLSEELKIRDKAETARRTVDGNKGVRDPIRVAQIFKELTPQHETLARYAAIEAGISEAVKQLISKYNVALVAWVKLLKKEEDALPKNGQFANASAEAKEVATALLDNVLAHSGFPKSKTFNAEEFKRDVLKALEPAAESERKVFIGKCLLNICRLPERPRDLEPWQICKFGRDLLIAIEWRAKKLGITLE